MIEKKQLTFPLSVNFSWIWSGPHDGHTHHLHIQHTPVTVTQIPCHSHLLQDILINWKKGKAQDQCDPRGPQTRQLGADRERLKDMMADSFSRNETISILPGFKENRSIAKPCIKLAASNSFSHRNAVKAEKSPAGNCAQGWKQQEFQNQQRQLQQQFYQQPQQPISQNRADKFQTHNGKNNDFRNDRGAGGDNDPTPWPYSKCQKSQRAIREAQAAYKRDLDRQIEEKRMNQKNNSRPVAAPKNSKDPETPRQLNQSVSLEAFRNTGFLPPWFDPIRNNPLYINSHSETRSDQNVSTGMCEDEVAHIETTTDQIQHGNPSQSEVLTNSDSSCPIDYQPSQIVYSQNPANIANLDGNYYIVSQDILNQLNQGSLQIQNLPMYPGHTYNPNPTQNPASSQSLSRHQVSGATNEIPKPTPPNPQQQNSYNCQSIQAPTSNTQQSTTMQSVHISQIQHHQPNNNTQVHSAQQPHQQNIWTPWLSSNNFSLNLRNLPPPPTPPTDESQSNQASPAIENSQFGTPSQDCDHQIQEKEIPNAVVPDSTKQSDEQEFSQKELKKNSNAEETQKGNDLAADSTDNIDQFYDNNEAYIDRTTEDFRATPLPHVSQTSSQRPNEEKVRLRYKSELAKQIEEKKRLEQEKAARQEEQEAKMQKKVEEDQKRMVEEYEKEQNLEKIKQEEYKKRQEIIVKEIERLDRVAEAEKERKKLERRKGQAALLMQRSEESLEESKPLVYESPIDLTVCAASKWKSLERIKSPVKSESSDISDCHSPRPRTVVISQHRPIKESPKINAPVSEPLPSTSTNSFDSDKLQHDVSFLATVRQALRDEDTRIIDQEELRISRYIFTEYGQWQAARECAPTLDERCFGVTILERLVLVLSDDLSRAKKDDGWKELNNPPAQLHKDHVNAHGRMELLSHKNASSPDPLHQEVIFKRPSSYQKVKLF
ncbi:unnamed protein product [Allacma fusca]|uniref:Uncharacterized protein n=1 Tax=Allacma fusca TaxID=39272 RepID=A0A8J2JFG3_9HEXA|nr:unnamed protein product [Allacma fusca]